MDHTHPQVIRNSKINAFGTVLKFILPFPLAPIFVRPGGCKFQEVVKKLFERSHTESLCESDGID